jgi:erythronate-4-phosphate dehydrogenase
VEQYITSTLLYLAAKEKLKLNKLSLGVVGVGNVGTKVARMGRALGMKVLLNDPPRQRDEKKAGFIELNQLLEEADIITLHVPLIREGSDKTYHMVDQEFQSRVKKGAVLFNTSRGPVVDEFALIKGLEAGIWSDVVLDVFENEPDISPVLLDLITLATPHIAGYSLDGKANGTTISVRAISRFFGLGLDDWSPSHVPPPEISEIQADASDFDLQELLWHIYRQCYDVSEDDRRLRNSPQSFEKLRGDYPPRREAGAYSVRLFQGYPEVTDVLEAMGFSVLGDYCV